MYKRTIEDQIKSEMFKGKIQIIYGPRQAGKTTLAKKIASESGKTFKLLRGDDLAVRELLSYPTLDNLKKVFDGAEVVVLDEAQSVPNIGTSLKLFYDYDLIKNTQIIVTGSSSFDLKNRLSEAMTGRHYSYMLYPLSVAEVADDNAYYEMKINNKEGRMMKYGSYPDIFDQGAEHAQSRLTEIVESTLYKDVFVMEGVKKPEVLVKLVRTLAINISHTVTVGRLAQMTGTTNITVERYLDLLEKTFVIKRLYSFSRNMNNELKRATKVYFIDIGFRNSVIQNFNDFDVRNDIGQVFENFWIMERIKRNEYERYYCNKYFWQTYGGVEIDYLEERDGTLTAYECKWTDRKSKGLKVFEAEYKKENAKVVTISRDNYLEYLK